MNGISDPKSKISDLFRSQSLAVLASQRGGQSHANLIAFAATDDLRTMLFCTSRATRKFSNISENSSVALLVDNRSNSLQDFMDTVAVTAIGNAFEATGSGKDNLARIYLAKHPHLSHFVRSPNQALIRIDVSKYILVDSFQRVLEMNVDE